jgi:hypothetical protein
MSAAGWAHRMPSSSQRVRSRGSRRCIGSSVLLARYGIVDTVWRVMRHQSVSLRWRLCWSARTMSPMFNLYVRGQRIEIAPLSVGSLSMCQRKTEAFAC